MNDSSTPPDDEVPIVGKLVGKPTDYDSGKHKLQSDPSNAVQRSDLSDAEVFAEVTEVSAEVDVSAVVTEPGNPFAQNTGFRKGSPFANDPDDLWDDFLPVAGVLPTENLYDVGPLKYTAIGSVAAAVMVLGFAGAASWWFPGGGTLIAALGCALSIFGLYSPRKQWAAGCLVLHLMLFLFSYSRAIMV
ncbi:MAG: hypothetical protein WBD20_06465 [Pirellulaceae bacterium]